MIVYQFNKILLLKKKIVYLQILRLLKYDILFLNQGENSDF